VSPHPIEYIGFMGTKILVADDDQLVRSTVGRILKMFGHETVTVDNGLAVLDTVDDDFDAIILDIDMPKLDGFETLARLNEKNTGIPVIFFTGAGIMDNAVKAINLGAYDFMTKPIDDLDIFRIKVDRAIEKRNYVRREKEYRKKLEDEVRQKTYELARNNLLLEEYSANLEKTTVQIMTSLQNAMEEKDCYTAGHTLRVTEFSMQLGEKIMLSEDDLVVLKRAAQFHDIGKLVIDLSCIQKPGKLTREEWELIRKHPAVGANIIEPLGFVNVESDIIRHHHERLDGGGYPDGIGGGELDTMTRIITIADSYDAMTSRRNYRRNMTATEAVEELRRCAHTQFDPDLVEEFAEIILAVPALLTETS